MASVNFNLKEPNSKTETLIIARVYYSGRSFKLSTQQKIDPLFWDSVKQRARVTHKNRHHSNLNLALDSLVVTINKAHLDFQSQNVVPTKLQFKQKINFMDSGGITLMGFFDVFMRAKNGKVSHNTFKKYISCKNHLLEYQRIRKKQIDFPDVDFDFYYDWINYFYSHLGSSANTAGKNVSILKVVLNEATEQGVNQNLTFRSRKFKIPNFPTDYVYLKLSELDTLYNHKPSSKKLERVRDSFLIGCYTGLRFSDFSSITLANIQTLSDRSGNPVEVIKMRTQKTKTQIVVPINKRVKSIILKYSKNGTLKLPFISNQKMNQYIKELCREAGLINPVEVIRSVSGQPVKKTYAKCDLIITHSARSTFISNAIISKIPEKAIMQMTGISSKTTLQRYNRLSVEENAIYMSDNPLFK